MKSQNDIGAWKATKINCKQCDKEFEVKCPLEFYETMLAVAKRSGEDVIFTGTCPECRKDDPFLALMDKCGIPTLTSNKVI